MNSYIDLDVNDTPLYNGLTGNRPICFIAGDTYTYIVQFEDSNLAGLIQKLVFSCNYFDIEQEFAKQDDTFTMTFVTENMTPINTTYDVIAYIKDGSNEIIATETGIPFRVIKRENPVGGTE